MLSFLFQLLLEDLSISLYNKRKWKGVEGCSDCSKTSCRCLEDLSSLEYLYSWGDYQDYQDIDMSAKLPMCDKRSRKIDGQGKPWCYVQRHTDCCGDNKRSTKYPHVDWSYQACQAPQIQGCYTF